MMILYSLDLTVKVVEKKNNDILKIYNQTFAASEQFLVSVH